MTKTSTGAVVSEQNKNPLTQVDASIRHARFSDRLATRCTVCNFRKFYTSFDRYAELHPV